MATFKKNEKVRPIPIRKLKGIQFDRAVVIFLGFFTSAVCAFYLLKVGQHVWGAVVSDWAYHHNGNFYAAIDTPTFENIRAAHKTKELYLGDIRKALHNMYTKEGWQTELAGCRFNVPWRLIEGVLGGLYLLFFFCAAFRVPKRSGDVTNSGISKNIEVPSILPRSIVILGASTKKIAVFVGESVPVYLFVFSLCVIGFIFSYTALIGAAYYGVHADFTYFLRILAWIYASTVIALISYLAFTVECSTGAISENRRVILKTAVSSIISAVALNYLAKIPQIVKLGFIPSPRFKNKTGKTRHIVALPPGLYQHTKNGKIYYVDDAKVLHAYHPISPKNLIRLSSIGEAQFNKLPAITAKAYFEIYGLYLLSKSRFLDALAVFELGCKYEIFRLAHAPSLKPNIRVFKLYSGLCHRSNKKDRLLLLRKRIRTAGLEAILQPPPEKWLKTKAWRFKLRWTNRSKYNGRDLTAIV